MILKIYLNLLCNSILKVLKPDFLRYIKNFEICRPKRLHT